MVESCGAGSIRFYSRRGAMMYLNRDVHDSEAGWNQLSVIPGGFRALGHDRAEGGIDARTDGPDMQVRHTVSVTVLNTILDCAANDSGTLLVKKNLAGSMHHER